MISVRDGRCDNSSWTTKMAFKREGFDKGIWAARELLLAFKDSKKANLISLTAENASRK